MPGERKDNPSIPSSAVQMNETDVPEPTTAELEAFTVQYDQDMQELKNRSETKSAENEKVKVDAKELYLQFKRDFTGYEELTGTSFKRLIYFKNKDVTATGILASSTAVKKETASAKSFWSLFECSQWNCNKEDEEVEQTPALRSPAYQGMS